MASRSISKSFPGFSSIYVLKSRGTDRSFRADVEMETLEQARVIPRAEMVPSCPVPARWAMGRKKPGDIIWTTLATPVLVSERVIRLLRDEGFTGWSTYKVELFGHDGTPIPGYHGLSIHGRCGPIDDSRSVEIPTITPGGIFPHWFGLYFDEDTWDGSDFFMPDCGAGWKFVVEDVKRAFEKARIKNVVFTPPTEIERLQL